MDNLFNYATSELSNDAFLCWLISISKEKYSGSNPIEYNVSQTYLRKFCNYGGKIYVYDDGIKRQEDHIDILIKGKYDNKEEFIIAIEDKTKSDEHSDQLRKYKKFINEKYGDKNCHFIYYKTSIQSDNKKIENKGYTALGIYDIYDMLEEGGAGKSNNQLIADYYNFIKDEVASYDHFKKDNICDWNTNAFIGFFSHMSGSLRNNESVKNIGFGYYDNRNGGKYALHFGNDKKAANENGQKIGFHLSLETPNTNKDEKWVCRLIIRANKHDDKFKWTKADIEHFIGTIGEKTSCHSGKYIILAELFKIRGDDSKNDYTYLENKINENLVLYSKWQAERGFK
jgi:hypothetical protein